MDEKKHFYVQNTDGRKFKMVIRGELEKLSVAKVRRYLQSYGVPETAALVTQEGVALSSDMLGENFGLQVNAVLYLRDPTDPHATSSALPRPEDSANTQPTTNTRTEPSLQNDQHALTSTPQHSRNTGAKASMQQWLQPHEAWAAAASAKENGTASMLPYTSVHTTAHIEPASAQTNQFEAEAEEALAHSSPHSHIRHLEEINAKLQSRLDMLQGKALRAPSPDTKNTHSTATIETVKRRNQRSSTETTDNTIQHFTKDAAMLNARQNIAELSNKLNIPLSIDAASNLTCSVGTYDDSGVSMLITYDPPTERLYIYSTLLTELPRNNAVKLKLYEILLEGSLLGREVCGGGIGISLRDELVVLTTSLSMRTSLKSALVDTLPSFVETVIRWRQLVEELIR